MLLTDARRAARTGPHGELVPMAEQDRALWNAVLALGALPSAPPRELPHGVVAIVGWTDRLLILSAWAWVSVTAWHATGVQRTATTSKAG